MKPRPLRAKRKKDTNELLLTRVDVDEVVFGERGGWLSEFTSFSGGDPAEEKLMTDNDLIGNTTD